MGTFMLTSGLLIQFRQTSLQSSEEEEEEGGGVVEKASEPEDVTPLINVDKAVRVSGCWEWPSPRKPSLSSLYCLRTSHLRSKRLVQLTTSSTDFFVVAQMSVVLVGFVILVGAGCGLPRLKYVVQAFFYFQHHLGG